MLIVLVAIAGDMYNCLAFMPLWNQCSRRGAAPVNLPTPVACRTPPGLPNLPRTAPDLTRLANAARILLSPREVSRRPPFFLVM